jgi:hypothetical protein
MFAPDLFVRIHQLTALSRPDIRAATNAGIAIVAVTVGGQRYCYDAR